MEYLNLIIPMIMVVIIYISEKFENEKLFVPCLIILFILTIFHYIILFKTL